MNIQVVIHDKKAMKLLKTLEPRIHREFVKAGEEYGRVAKDDLKRQFISQTKKAPRTNLANKFKVVKLNNTDVGISLPIQAVYLDRMKPHYVSLRRGRLITRWASRYFDGSYGKTGKSRVHRSKKGIKGALYVTPDPFIDKATERSLPKLQPILRSALKGLKR